MIKYLVMDVDGTLTDGKIYMGPEGELAKAFDIKDGAGIVLMLPKENITPVVITARKSKILDNRCKELNITSFHQNIKDKLAKLKEEVGDLSTVAYVGDDLLDIPCMEAVKAAGGLVLAPADAISEVRALANYISRCNAGDGAIRDCINYLVSYNQSRSNPVLTVGNRIREVMEQIISADFSNSSAGEKEFGNGTKYNLLVYDTKNEKDCIIESHRTHIDIQYMVEGRELLKIYNTSCLTSGGDYNKNKDCEVWNSGLESTELILVPGSMVVIHSGQPHKGAIMVGEKAETVKKVVCKIEV